MRRGRWAAQRPDPSCWLVSSRDALAALGSIGLETLPIVVESERKCDEYEQTTSLTENEMEATAEQIGPIEAAQAAE